MLKWYTVTYKPHEEEGICWSSNVQACNRKEAKKEAIFQIKLRSSLPISNGKYVIKMCSNRKENFK